MLSILFIQVYWIKSTVQIQENKREIQAHQDSINERQFIERIHISLREIAQDISSFNKDSSGLYGDINQQSKNYFTVNINDTVNPFLLEQLLKREFYSQSIKEDFLYGIYDCFSDSIIYGNYISYNNSAFEVADKQSSAKIPTLTALKLNQDGHYFSVYFPNRPSGPMKQISTSYSPWFSLGAIILVVLVFFGYSLSVIFRQKKLSEIKNDFINNMTHEFKTPISTIALSSETLLQDSTANDKGRVKQYAEIIYKENKRLENQVERVLNVAKLDKDELKLTMSEIDIHALIQEAKDVFELNQMESGGKIELILNAKQHQIKADEVHIGNVIHNLLDNAIKYCEKSPHIIVKTYDTNKNIVIEITDNGIGISKENQHMIFDQFYRVPTGNIHNVKGFGLGLYYVQLIVQSHKGKIALKSQINQGTTFKISLPIA